MMEIVFNKITLWWPPLSSDIQCGKVSYNVTRAPSHGTLKRNNDTFYTITQLNYNTTYNITVLPISDTAGEGDPASITVKSMHVIKYLAI